MRKRERGTVIKWIRSPGRVGLFLSFNSVVATRQSGKHTENSSLRNKSRLSWRSDTFPLFGVVNWEVYLRSIGCTLQVIRPSRRYTYNQGWLVKKDPRWRFIVFSGGACCGVFTRVCTSCKCIADSAGGRALQFIGTSLGLKEYRRHSKFVVFPLLLSRLSLVRAS